MSERTFRWVCGTSCLVILLALIFAKEVLAGEATLRWTNPTSCINGELIGQGSCKALTGIEVERAAALAGPWNPVVTVAPTLSTYKITNLAAGTHYFRLVASAGSVKSAPSAETATIDIPMSPPNAPTGLIVVQPTAYRENNSNANKVAHAIIGTVPLGTACSNLYASRVGNVTLNTILDRRKATLFASVTELPLQVWAHCATRPALDI